MFEYYVYAVDYSLGGFDLTFEYEGTDRKKALESYKEAKSWLGAAKLRCRVLGRKEETEYDRFLDEMLNSNHPDEEDDDDLPF